MYLPQDPTEVHPAGFVRRHCRNPRCGTKLKCETDKPRDAFCCAGCFEQYYRTVCLVCGRTMPQRGRRRRQFCRKRCQSEFHRHPEQFSSRFTPPCRGVADAGRNALTSAHSTGLKTGAKPGRAWRVVAGPAAALDPINLTIPLDPETAVRNRRANHRYQTEAARIGPRDWPIAVGDRDHRRAAIGDERQGHALGRHQMPRCRKHGDGPASDRTQTRVHGQAATVAPVLRPDQGVACAA